MPTNSSISTDAPVITLTTDFGLRDYYVSAMKAVITSITPKPRLIDISHDIDPHDVMSAAWVLKNSAFLYPAGCVHLAVVDPGVGTHRKPIAMRIHDQYFVGPDNGLFSLVASDQDYEAVELDIPDFWLTEKPSHTFHGRDIFAPAAAHLASGISLSEIGSKVEDIFTYKWALPVADKDGVQGWVVHIDRYGNVVTNITEDLVRTVIDEKSCSIYVGHTKLNQIADTFGDVSEGEPVAYIGSAGVLEIAVNKGSAHELLGIEKGSSINILRNSSSSSSS